MLLNGDSFSILQATANGTTDLALATALTISHPLSLQVPSAYDYYISPSTGGRAHPC